MVVQNANDSRNEETRRAFPLALVDWDNASWFPDS